MLDFFTPFFFFFFASCISMYDTLGLLESCRRWKRSCGPTTGTRRRYGATSRTASWRRWSWPTPASNTVTPLSSPNTWSGAPASRSLALTCCWTSTSGRGCLRFADSFFCLQPVCLAWRLLKWMQMASIDSSLPPEKQFCDTIKQNVNDWTVIASFFFVSIVLLHLVYEPWPLGGSLIHPDKHNQGGAQSWPQSAASAF